jgi:integrase
MLYSGVNIKVIAERSGHSAVNTLLNVYSHLFPGMQKEATDKLSDVLYS